MYFVYINHNAPLLVPLELRGISGAWNILYMIQRSWVQTNDQAKRVHDPV